MKSRLLALVMILSMVLTACGGAQAPASQGPVTISMMMWGDPAELDVWNKIVSDFHQSNPDITVKVDVSDWDSYGQS